MQRLATVQLRKLHRTLPMNDKQNNNRTKQNMDLGKTRCYE